MAVIAISRQVAALGDELAAALAKKLGYSFIDRKAIESKILELGFSQEKLKMYDERKPGFFASLVKERDEYLNYLIEAICSEASKNNCVLIGRGTFSVLEGLPNLFSVRCVAPNKIREQRLMNEFGWDEKQAQRRIEESHINRVGFHKSFFNVDCTDSSCFHCVINTGLVDVEVASDMLATMCKNLISPEKEKEGEKLAADWFVLQKLVNHILFECKLSINFLRAISKDDVIILHGIADSIGLVEKAISITKDKFPDRKVESCISVVQDFKAYP